MPQRKPPLTAARWRRSRWDEWDEPPASAPVPVKRTRHLGKTLTFVAACASGAALSAGATTGVPLPAEDLVPVGEPGDPATVTTTATAPAEPAPTDPGPAAPAPAEPASAEPAPAAQRAGLLLGEPEPVSVVATPPRDAGGSAPPAGPPIADPAPTVSVATPAREPSPKPAARATVRPKAKPDRRGRGESVLRARPRPRRLGSELEPEVRVPGVDATVWLHRSLPDPTPPSKRLSRSFAGDLRTVARTSHADWALLLGLLRAEGRTGAVPAGVAELRLVASRLDFLRGQDVRGVAIAIAGSKEKADRAVALAHYHRAVGLPALVRGLEWAKPLLEARLLRDDRVATYEGGWLDIESGHVDVRVLALIAYLADTYGEVTVSSLKTGHRLYSRPGVISAHVYGLAVDIAALGGTPIAGNQQPGGLTEDAVRNILLLPSELQPRQVISLLGLGGPSFPLGDHGDHIHVGY